VHVTDPTEEELEQLESGLRLEHGHLTDALDPHENPRLEVEGKDIYIFLRFPYFDREDTIATAPVLFVITSEMVVTVVKEGGRYIFDEFIKGKVEFYTTQRARFLVYFFLKINLLYQQTVSTINKRLRAKRDQLLGAMTDTDLVTFVQWEDTLNDFITALVPASAIYKTLLSKHHIEFFEEDQDLVEDLMLSNDEAVDVCKTNIRTIVNIREAYSAIATNSLNRTMKFLTAVTIVLAVPTLIASIYGMNVPLPFQDVSHSFIVVMVIIVLSIAVTMWVFNKKRWF
jgi:magnesium transporter